MSKTQPGLSRTNSLNHKRPVHGVVHPWLKVALCCVVVTLTQASRLRAAHAGPGLTAILKSHNVQPLDPAPQAPSFTLPTVQGGSVSLDKFRGRWVLLTFFATWCGPCAAEMPSLQGLYDSMRDKGLDVLAVAVDPEDDVANYVHRKKMTFPVVLDTRGQAASAYQASSIPITYLMDPAGKLVGVAQGARDWQAASTLIDALMREVPVSTAGLKAAPVAPSAPAPAVAPEPDKPLALPSNVVPPEAHAEVQESVVKVGKPFHLNVTVQWAGSLRDYILLPPTVALPKGVRNLGTAATTNTESGRATIVYSLTLVSDVIVPAKLDPVEIRYQPAGQSEPMSRHIAGPTVDVQSLLGLDKTTTVRLVLVSAAVLMAGIVLGIAWFMRREVRRKRAALAKAPAEDKSHVLDAARRARIEGNVSTFMACMSELLSEPPELQREVAIISEGVRYGGKAPDSPTLDRLLRAAERRIETLASAPESRAEQSP